MEANEERQKPLPAKSAPINRGHTIADRTAGNIQGDVDVGSVGGAVRACLGRLGIEVRLEKSLFEFLARYGLQNT